jgi:hypothetical protein
MDDSRLEKLFTLMLDHLKVIHTLVNSNMTAAMQAELDATIRELAMMQEVIDIKRSVGQEPSPASLAALQRTEERVGELRATLQDRFKAGLVAAEQQKQVEAGTAEMT